MGGGGSPAGSLKTVLISVNDPEARHTRKSPENRRDGVRAHVVA